VSDPGDAQDLIAAFESEQGQSISNAKQFVKTYDELKQHAVKNDSVATHRPETIDTEPGREWSANNISDAIILSWARYPLLRTRVEVGKVVFIFGYNEDTKPLLARFNNHQLLIEPHAYATASRAMFAELKAAHEKSREVQGDMSQQQNQSKYKSPSTRERDSQRAQDRQSKQQLAPIASGLSNQQEEL